MRSRCPENHYSLGDVSSSDQNEPDEAYRCIHESLVQEADIGSRLWLVPSALESKPNIVLVNFLLGWFLKFNIQKRVSCRMILFNKFEQSKTMLAV